MPGVLLHRFGEVITVSLVLELFSRHEYWLAIAQVGTDNFLAACINPANLVVNLFCLCQAHEHCFDLPNLRRVRIAGQLLYC